ncbi:hypothetical protein [Lactobacillus taiwanensis]|uniref:hypothetical protein n=1 Tax=Lactobacillus taiwanensis TaxID=508451 RepID=UPI00242B6108|nr:hypothetical protein [Lactobacillus taiwanensis]
MSLDIIAYDPVETENRRDKFEEKYGLSCEEFNDWMLVPSKDTFFYFLHPEFLKSDTKKYEEMEKDADKAQGLDKIDSFHIGYGHFHCLRKELGELVGVRHDDENPFDPRIYYDDELEDTALLRFFLHPDCDGAFSSYDIQKSYEQFLKLCDEKKLQDKKVGTWGKEIDEFLKFWRKSSEQKLQWEFC